MSKRDVYRILRAHGMKRNTGLDNDYIRAKQIMFGSGIEIDTKEYERIIKFVCDYLNY